MQASWHLPRNVSAGVGYKIGPDGKRVKVDRFEYRRIPRDIVRDIARCRLGGEGWGVKVQGKGECASSCATSDGAEKAGKGGNAREEGNGGKK